VIQDQPKEDTVWVDSRDEEKNKNNSLPPGLHELLDQGLDYGKALDRLDSLYAEMEQDWMNHLC
jgi:hypothetical protein